MTEKVSFPQFFGGNPRGRGIKDMDAQQELLGMTQYGWIPDRDIRG